MPPIQILFVDGPTAVGKDFFIDNFMQAYSKKYPHAKLTKVRAADIVLQGKAKTQDRKYTTYDTPVELVKSIYQGHLDLLEYLRVQSDLLGCNDLIVVNRSFLSYYIYNFKVLLRQYKPEGLQQTIKTLKPYNLNSYSQEYKSKLKGLSTMFVGLRVREIGLDKKVELLTQRAGQRQDGMPVVEDWFKYLVVSYETDRPAFLSLFDAHVSLSSSHYKLMLDDYF